MFFDNQGKLVHIGDFVYYEDVDRYYFYKVNTHGLDLIAMKKDKILQHVNPYVVNEIIKSLEEFMYTDYIEKLEKIIDKIEINETLLVLGNMENILHKLVENPSAYYLVSGDIEDIILEDIIERKK